MAPIVLQIDGGQKRAAAELGCGVRGFTAGVPAPDYDDIESLSSCWNSQKSDVKAS